MSPLRLVAILLLASVGLADAAERVRLAAPLSTRVALPRALEAAPAAVVVELTVPADAPADLGCGIYLNDDDGRWWQIAHPQRLGPGRQRLRIAIDPLRIHGEEHAARWSPWHASRIRRGGLFLWSAAASGSEIVIHRLAVEPATAATAPAATGRLLDLDCSGADWNGDGGTARTGERLEWRLRPDPFPVQPFDPQHFELRLELTGPAGTEVVHGFYRQPMRLVDRGDREAAIPEGADHFALRWRARRPGTYQATLVARWGGGPVQRHELPPLTITGPARDPYVRVDPADPRFFATGDGAFFWPVGLNARSVNDPRGAEFTGSRLSPARGWQAYEAYLERWAANGVTAAEVWMSSWNLALEWRADWPGYHGAGAYHQGNAERLDRLLTRAEELGIRINLVIRNHGQASVKTDAEWQHNPWNAAVLGGPAGPVAAAAAFFTEPAALTGQDRLRRYIVARWADHPSLLGWKLWSEINLTAGERADLRSWHRQAARAWAALDPYDHPVTTHWSGDYRTPDRAIVGMSEIDYVTIDAYHNRDPNRGRRGAGLWADLAWDGLHHPRQGLARYAKPILITEYGGNWNAGPQAQLLAEHHQGPWAALVSGYAGSPMLWWLEWVDQGDRYQPYRAISAFLAGEDLRNRPGHPAAAVVLRAEGSAVPLWVRAWTRRGHLLGYALDEDWGYDGEDARAVTGARLVIAENAAAGPMQVEWWNADTGECRERARFEHPGGQLVLTAPSFQRHLALKLTRVEAAAE